MQGQYTRRSVCLSRCTQCNLIAIPTENRIFAQAPASELQAVQHCWGGGRLCSTAGVVAGSCCCRGHCGCRLCSTAGVCRSKEFWQQAVGTCGLSCQLHRFIDFLAQKSIEIGHKILGRRRDRIIACIADDLPADVQPRAPCSTSCRSRRIATTNACCTQRYHGIVLQSELASIDPMAWVAQVPTSPLWPSACLQAIASQPEPNPCIHRSSQHLAGQLLPYLWLGSALRSFGRQFG